MGAADWLPQEERERWRVERERVIREVDVPAVHGEFIIRSIDGGRTWSEPIPTGVSAPHGPIELDDGSLLYLGGARAPYAKWAGGATFAGTSVTAAVSRDDGLTWENVGEVPVVEGQSVDNYFEPHAVQTPDGRLLVHIRNRVAWPKENTWQSESFDGGRTWSVPRELPFGNIAHPAHLLRLRDGRILSTFGWREEPFGNRASVSNDCGETWCEPLVISDDGSNRDLGYPSTVEMGDGNLLSVWYEKRDDVPKAILRQAFWRLP